MRVDVPEKLDMGTAGQKCEHRRPAESGPASRLSAADRGPLGGKINAAFRQHEAQRKPVSAGPAEHETAGQPVREGTGEHPQHDKRPIHTEEVTGSIPVSPTCRSQARNPTQGPGLFRSIGKT